MSPELEAAWAAYRAADARVRTAPLSTWSQPSYRRLEAARAAAAEGIRKAAAR